jgi:hypothetical protein
VKLKVTAAYRVTDEAYVASDYGQASGSGSLMVSGE